MAKEFECTNKKLEQYLYALGMKPTRTVRRPDYMTAWIFEETPTLLRAVDAYGDLMAKRHA